MYVEFGVVVFPVSAPLPAFLLTLQIWLTSATSALGTSWASLFFPDLPPVRWLPCSLPCAVRWIPFSFPVSTPAAPLLLPLLHLLLPLPPLPPPLPLELGT